MNQKVTPDNFDKSLIDLLKEYGDKVFEVGKEAIDETADEIVNELKNAGDFKGKKFRQSWGKEEDKSASKFGYSMSIANKKHGQLTHLLEFGHLTRNGRSRTKAFNFIAPINDEAERKLLKNVERKINDI